MVTNGETLPCEILLQIFENVADLMYRELSGEVAGGLEEWRRTDESQLGKVALVSRMWTSAAQTILFRRIYIEGTSRTQVSLFLRTAKSRPDLMDQVRCLHLGSIERKMEGVASDLIRILSLCTKVRRLEVDAINTRYGQSLLNALSLPRNEIRFFSSGLPPLHPIDILKVKAFSNLESCYWLLDRTTPSPKPSTSLLLTSDSNSATNETSLPSLKTLSITQLLFKNVLPLVTPSLENFVLYAGWIENLSISNDYSFTNDIKRFQYFTPLSPTSAKLLIQNLKNLTVLSIFLQDSFTSLLSVLNSSSTLEHLEFHSFSLAPHIANFNSLISPTISQFTKSLRSLRVVVESEQELLDWRPSKQDNAALNQRGITFTVSRSALSLPELFSL